MISHLALYLSSSSGGNDGAISAFDVRDDGNYIYVASTNCLSIFNVHDVTGFLPKHTIYYKQPKPISKLLIQKKDGNFFGTLRNNVVALWDPNNSIRPLINILQMNSISINDFKWHPNDSSILFTTFTSTNTGGALVWDVRQSTKPMQTIISQGRDCSKLDIYSSGSNDILATLMDNKHVCVSDLRMIISTPVDDSLVHSNTRAQVICAQDPIREVRDIQFYGSGTATTIGNNLKNSKTTEQDSSNILLSYEDGAMDLWKVDLSAGCSLLGTVSPRARTRSELSAVADRHEEVEEDVTVSIPCPASFGALQYREEATVSHTGRNHQNIRRQHVINLFSFHPASLSSPFTDESCEPNSVLLYSKSSAESLVGLMWAPNHTNVGLVSL